MYENPERTPAPPNVKALLKRYGVRPRKSLGQHFLIHQNSLKKVTATAALDGSETILEIGAGLGSLTYYLAFEAKRVIAVEIDSRLCSVLERALLAFNNVAIVQGDILAIDLDGLLEDQPYQVVANIPYHITSNLIREFLERQHPPDRMILTVQQEVAHRIIAEPGQMNLLALSVQLYGEPEIKGKIPSKYFYPEPNVDSAIVRIIMHPNLSVDRALVPVFFRIARAGFQQKRKKLRNSLSAGLHLAFSEVEGALEQAGISPDTRPQTLDVASWIRLTMIMADLLTLTDVEQI